jgi:hypothetical protein
MPAEYGPSSNEEIQFTENEQNANQLDEQPNVSRRVKEQMTVKEKPALTGKDGNLEAYKQRFEAELTHDEILKSREDFVTHIPRIRSSSRSAA